MTLPPGRLTVLATFGGHSAHNPPDGVVRVLDRSPFRVGCYLEADLFFSAHGISRMHASFEVENGVWRVRDMESTFGTWVAGARATNHELADGERILIGPLGDPDEGVQTGIVLEFSAR